jgi:hypothetical protein
MSSDTSPSLTTLVQSIPAPTQHHILNTITAYSKAIDTAFAHSPAVADIDSTVAPADYPIETTDEPVRTLRQHLTFPSNWRSMQNLLGRSTWEEANTGMAVEVVQQEPDENYLLYSPPRSPGTMTVTILSSLETAYLSAQLLIEVATSREQAEFVGLTPAETAATITDTHERGTQYPHRPVRPPRPTSNGLSRRAARRPRPVRKPLTTHKNGIHDIPHQVPRTPLWH